MRRWLCALALVAGCQEPSEAIYSGTVGPAGNRGPPAPAPGDAGAFPDIAQAPPVIDAGSDAIRLADLECFPVLDACF